MVKLFCVAFVPIGCIILILLAASIADAKVKGTCVKQILCDETLAPFLVVAAEEVDLLHSTVAVFTAKMPIKLHDFRVAVSELLQQLGIHGAVTIRLGAEVVSKSMNGPGTKASFAVRCWKQLSWCTRCFCRCSESVQLIVAGLGAGKLA